MSETTFLFLTLAVLGVAALTACRAAAVYYLGA